MYLIVSQGRSALAGHPHSSICIRVYLIVKELSTTLAMDQLCIAITPLLIIIFLATRFKLTNIQVEHKQI